MEDPARPPEDPSRQVRVQILFQWLVKDKGQARCGELGEARQDGGEGELPVVSM